ncbi:MAG: hypothetical protein U0892_21365 [Pirellulales bacterium]
MQWRACHGAAAKRGGLRLRCSVLIRHRTIDRLFGSRRSRVHLARPEKSLLLTKPLEKIPTAAVMILMTLQPPDLLRWVDHGQHLESPQLLSIRVLPADLHR